LNADDSVAVAQGAAAVHHGSAVRLSAPAKINLALEVRGRREDGFHELRTILQALDLADELRLERHPGGVGIALEVIDELPTPGAGRAVESGAGTSAPILLAGPENLAWRAAVAFGAAIGDPAPGAARQSAAAPAVRIRLHKRIPIGAGLGGGSADAAAVLLGLNLLLGRPLGASALFAIGATLGADVPFALAGGTCFATGRGEQLRRLPALPPMWIVLVAPMMPIATRWAYDAWDAEPLTGEGASASILESAIRQESPSRIAAALRNDLEPVVVRRYGAIQRIREELLARGALGARMSGSGSAVFALFDAHGDALQVAADLRRFEHPVIVCCPSPSGCRPLNG
jgi:4-diphosphocytidyl-2-C-methyl-D-erythritol kinase